MPERTARAHRALVSLVAAAAMTTIAPANAADLLIANARVIDGTGARPVEGVSLLIRAGRITAIAPGLTAADVPTLDAGGATVLPGLVDAHVHFASAPGFAYRHDSPATLRDLNHTHLRAYVACGVTTVLDAGIDLATARDIQAWLAAGHPGPRFLTTGPYVRPPQGYGWDGFGAESTVDEVDAKLDAIAALGGSGVKLAFEEGSNPTANLSGFSPELRQRIIDGAARRHLPLFVHATTENAQREALAWGARALMHAVWGGRWIGGIFAPRDLTDDFIRQMKAAGAFQVTTFSLMDTWPGSFRVERLDDPLVRLAVPPLELATARDPAAADAFAISMLAGTVPWAYDAVRLFIAHRIWTEDTLGDGLRYSQRNVRRLYDAGVPIAVGSDAPSPWPDAIYNFHGPTTLREIELVGEAGLPAMAAIAAATRVPAEMLGLADQIGTVEIGKRADLLIVRGDPLADLHALHAIKWTVRDGIAHTPEEWMTH